MDDAAAVVRTDITAASGPAEDELSPNADRGPGLGEREWEPFSDGREGAGAGRMWKERAAAFFSDMADTPPGWVLTREYVLPLSCLVGGSGSPGPGVVLFATT